MCEPLRGSRTGQFGSSKVSKAQFERTMFDGTHGVHATRLGNGLRLLCSNKGTSHTNLEQAAVPAVGVVSSVRYQHVTTMVRRCLVDAPQDPDNPSMAPVCLRESQAFACKISLVCGKSDSARIVLEI